MAAPYLQGGGTSSWGDDVPNLPQGDGGSPISYGVLQCPLSWARPEGFEPILFLFIASDILQERIQSCLYCKINNISGFLLTAVSFMK